MKSLRLGFVASSLLLVAGSTIVHAQPERYVDWHRNYGIGGPYERVFYPTNNIDVPPARQQEDGEELEDQFGPPALQPQDEEFMSGLQALKDIVGWAAEDGMRVRAYGSRWSLTDVPYVADYQIDTYALTYTKIGIEDDQHVTRDYRTPEQKKQLVFVQGGVMVKYLYQALVDKGLTLSTSPLSDGQTIAGAISTGSHNAAIYVGAMQEMVKGIHLVLPGRTVLLQRATDQVVTELYKSEIGADEIINDDALFNAAVVSFGTFGIIHGFLIETEPLFRLEVEVKDLRFSQAKDAFYTLDPASLDFDLNNPAELPWHFESYINPYFLERSDGCKVRVMQKVPLSADEIAGLVRGPAGGPYIPKYVAEDPMIHMGKVYGSFLLLQQALRLAPFEKLVKSLERIMFGIANQLVMLLIMDIANRSPNGFPLEVYGDGRVDTYFSPDPASTTTMEVATSLQDSEKVLSLILDVLYEHPVPTQIDVRYVKSTQATLGFSRFGDITVLMDMPSVDMPQTRQAYVKTQEALEELRDSDGVSFAYHWGKMLPMNKEWIGRSFGPALDEWKLQRQRLLSTPLERYLFSSDFTDTLGLTGAV